MDRAPLSARWRWKNLVSLYARRGIDVRNGDLDVFDRAVDLTQPVWRARHVHDDVSRANASRQASIDANRAANNRVRIRVRVDIAIDRRRDQGAARHERG